MTMQSSMGSHAFSNQGELLRSRGKTTCSRSSSVFNRLKLMDVKKQQYNKKKLSFWWHRENNLFMELFCVSLFSIGQCWWKTNIDSLIPLATTYRKILHIAPLDQYQNEKRPTSQLEALLDEGFLGRAPLIDSLAFLNFVSWILLLISPPHYNNGLVLFRWRRCPEVHLAFRATQGSLSIGHRQALGLFTFG